MSDLQPIPIESQPRYAGSSTEQITPDRLLFAARMRTARAALGWSQTELGRRANVTQRAIYCLEKAVTQARHSTELRIERAFREAGIEFASLPSGGFKLEVPRSALAGS